MRGSRSDQPAVPGLPVLEGRRADPVLATLFSSRHPSLLHLRDRNYLLIAKPRSLHLSALLLQGRTLPLAGGNLRAQTSSNQRKTRKNGEWSKVTRRAAQSKDGHYRPAQSSLTIWAPFSPIIIDGAFVLPEMRFGMIDASTTRRPSMP